MGGRNIHFSNASIFISLLTAGLALFFCPRKYTSEISLFFYDTFQPVLRIGRDIQVTPSRLDAGTDDVVSHDKYARLWKSYQNLDAKLKTLHEEYERLANIRSGLPQLSAEGLIMAKITGAVSNYSHEVVINKGSDAFVRPGQYVLSEQHDAAAVIGIVSDVSETVARVRLVTDSMQTLEIRIRRSGTDMDIPAMLIGNGTDTCSISMIDQQRDIRSGDIVYAAAVPGKLSFPLVIGEVVDVRADDLNPLLWKITVRPAENMAELNNVAVIVADEKLLRQED